MTARQVGSVPKPVVKIGVSLNGLSVSSGTVHGHGRAFGLREGIDGGSDGRVAAGRSQGRWVLSGMDGHGEWI